MSQFQTYINKLKTGFYKTAVKVSWLNDDETIKEEFTNELYDINGSLSVNYQNGARRSCTIVVSNDNGKFPVDYNNIWLGQKFQLWVGIYLDDNTPYYISQGIFYIKNPKETYNPEKKTLTLQGVDKWAYLDGSLFGYLRGTYKSLPRQNIKTLVSGLLNKSKYNIDFNSVSDLSARIDPKNAIYENFQNKNAIAEVQGYEESTGNPVYKINFDKVLTYFIISKSTDNKDILYKCKKEEIKQDETVIGYKYTISKTGETEDTFSKEDTATIIKEQKYELETYEQSIFLNPYTMTIESGKTLADLILEYANALFADVFYDESGYLRFVARDREKQDQSVYNKEIIWNFTVKERELLGLELTNAFDKVYNDIIVLGQIIGGKQMKARIQNRDRASDTNVFKIGIKTKPPYESDQYYSNKMCLDLAGYYAQIDMALDRTGSISVLPIYHMDVNKIVTLSTPNNNMSEEEFLVTGYSLPLNPIGKMSLNVTNLKYFTRWTDMTSSLEPSEDIELEEEEKEETNND